MPATSSPTIPPATRHQQQRPGFGILRLPHAGLLLCGSLVINLLALALPLMTMQIYDRVMINHASDTLLVLSLGVLLAAVVECALRLLRHAITSRGANAFEETATNQAISAILQSEPRAYAGKPAAELAQDIAAATRLKDYFGGQMAVTLLVDLPFAFVFLALVFYLTGALGCVTVGVLALTGLYFARRSRQLKALTLAREVYDNNRYAYITQTLQAQHTIKALCLEAWAVRRFEAVQQPGGPIVYNLAQLQNKSAAVSYLSGQFMIIAIISVGAFMTIQGHLTAGMLAAGIMLSGQLMQHLQRGLSSWLRWQDVTVAAGRLNSIVSLPGRNAYEPQELTGSQGALKLEGVRFAHSGQQPIISNASVELAPGEVLCLHGSSGSGKSTLLELVAGLYAPDRGQVYLSGLDPTRLPLDRRASFVGYLPTRSTIVQGTIMENLTGFDPRLVGEARLVAGALGIEQAVATLPGGYDTVLGQATGDIIPPGLKQRIAIARTLLHRPRVLLYDNADQGLDRESYTAVFTLLARLKRKTTMIIVSDDKNIQSLADRSLELRGGILYPLAGDAPTLQMREAAR